LEVPCSSRLEVETVTAKLKKYKSPGSDQIPAELIEVGGDILLSEINKLINSVWNKEELPDQWKEFVNVSVRKNGGKTDCNNYRRISLLSDCLCGLVVRVLDYRCRGPGFDSRALQKK
jgi:hypothetical protein